MLTETAKTSQIQQFVRDTKAIVGTIFPKIAPAMLKLGFKVQPRPCPQLILEDEDDSYYASYLLANNTIYLSKKFLRQKEEEQRVHTLAHELCHSQQPPLDQLPSYKKEDDGSIDIDRWLNEPREIEAERVADYISLNLKLENLSPQERGFIELVKSILTEPDLAAWLKWYNRKNILIKKPQRLSRKPRLMINKYLKETTPF